MWKSPISLCCLILCAFLNTVNGQEADDAIFIKGIYNKILEDGSAYQWLNHLTTQIGVWWRSRSASKWTFSGR